MVPLRDGFFNPELIYTPGHLDRFLVGLATQPRQRFDNIFTEEITNHLFQAKNKSFGMDLVALNIQRGRDHGLPGYNAFRELCGLGRVSSFGLLADFVPQKVNKIPMKTINSHGLSTNLQISHSFNLTLFQSHTLPILHSSSLYSLNIWSLISNLIKKSKH